MSALIVTVEGAVGLPNAKTFSDASDPVACVELYGVIKETQVIYGTSHPSWNEELTFELAKPLTASDKLHVLVKDRDKIMPDRLLGKALIQLKDILKEGQHTMHLTINLKDYNGRENGSTISVKIEYLTQEDSPPMSPTLMVPRKSSSKSTFMAKAAAAAKSKNTQPDLDEAGGFEDNAAPVKFGKVGKRKINAVLSTKPQDFQIRIKVVEARQLQGANISPITKITLRKQVRQTRVINCTCSPFWNDIFFFNTYSSPAELMDEIIHFGVFNSQMLRSDALVGAFKCDVGTIYREDDQCFSNKWLLLSDPKNPLAGAKGYLKISAAVLGSGDKAPIFKDPLEQVNDDIEENLLRTAGVQLRPITFTLRLYTAEDLPALGNNGIVGGIKKFFLGDSGRKNFPNSMASFMFAGREIKSSIIYNSDRPNWYEEMKMALQWPSMCNSLRLVIWNGETDEAVGAAVINISAISAVGEHDEKTGLQSGFLPTFGPAFINMYGSPRELDDTHDGLGSLNEGRGGTGMAYRGRILVELTATDKMQSEFGLSPISSDNRAKVNKFLQRRRYLLHAAFLSATMVASGEEVLQFEVSIGNYGNKLDVSVLPSCSTTEPTNAVFDGIKYHYLPWGADKPAVLVDSHWEDVSFRLYAINYILKMIDRLFLNLDKIRIASNANLRLEEQSRFVQEAADDLIVLVNSKILSWETQARVPENELDRNLRAIRETEMIVIAKNAQAIRQDSKNVENACLEFQKILDMLQNHADEPQNSLPDVVIWMIANGQRRAYYRIKAYDVLFCKKDQLRGRYCSRVMTINLMHALKKGIDDDLSWRIPAQLRLKLWLGMEKDDLEYEKMQGKEATLVSYAETYENQVSLLGIWGTKGPLMTRPEFSDAMGLLRLNKDKISLPDGWEWDGEWFIHPECSLFIDKDAHCQRFAQDVYVNQSRSAQSDPFKPARVPYTDVNGDVSPAPGAIKCPNNWTWLDDWRVDIDGPCDEEGWSYCVDATMGGYVPSEKNYHMHRRRRFIRTREMNCDAAGAMDKAARDESKDNEMWEYAIMFTQRFHVEKQGMDMVRRRRWHRKLKKTKPGAPCILKVSNENKVNFTSPRLYYTFAVQHTYQLRVYIYQARNLLSTSEMGMSNPYACVAFLNNSQKTKRIDNTICPTWDQTIIFTHNIIQEGPESVELAPPEVVIEIFDFDNLGADEFLGRVHVIPMVKLDSKEHPSPVMQWYKLHKLDREAGEILCACDLILLDKNPPPPLPRRAGDIYVVPEGIRPITERKGIEILSWGVRNLSSYNMSGVNSPSAEYEIGGHQVVTGTIMNVNLNPNFPSPLLFMEITLPKEELYMPPMNIRVRDNRQFGHKPVVGQHTIRSIEKFCYPALTETPNPMDDFPGFREEGADKSKTNLPAQPDKVSKGFKRTLENFFRMNKKKASKEESTPPPPPVGTNKSNAFDINTSNVFTNTNQLPPSKQSMVKITGKDSTKVDLKSIDEDIDWYSKYYASLGEWGKCNKYDQLSYDLIKVYYNELEKSENYNDFHDFCSTFDLTRGKTFEDDSKIVVGEIKGSFRVYPMSMDKSKKKPVRYLDPVSMPPSKPVECLVRVYIIKCVDLQPNNPSGLADSYIEINLGSAVVENKDNYVPNTLNPAFGTMFELRCRLPIEKDLDIRVRDYDLIGTHDIIGTTKIDLESRYLTRFRATCGIPETYNISGPNEYRDNQIPSEILDTMCQKYRVDKPTYDDNDTRCTLFNREIFLSKSETSSKNPHLGPPKEQLALKILNKMPIVKEHLEVRPLYSPLQPGIEQGRMHMWIDLHPLSYGSPGKPVDIKPRQPKKYQLRIIIRNTTDVILEEQSVTGEKMSDIYVKGWISGIEEKQETDVHYRSLDGEGNFNWRFVFNFDYLPGENVMVVKKRESLFAYDKTESRMPCNVIIQIWDNDKFSADDFLGTLEINLADMPAPAKKSDLCLVGQLSTRNKITNHINLFDCRRAYGFWPCINSEGGDSALTGKVEMELELLTAEEAETRPAGMGRDEPNANPKLDPPNRPDTSFLWFTSPWKTFKYIIWKNFKYYFIGALIIIVVGALIFTFVYALPGYTAKKMVGA